MQQKLKKLLAFHASSPKIFAPVAELEAMVNQGASQASGPEQKVVVPFQKTYNGRPPFPKKWQLRAEKIRKQEQAFHEARVKELKQYKVYAAVYYDQAGQPKIMWQLEKDGKGVTNPELYQYIS